jgi:hypothetical protein
MAQINSTRIFFRHPNNPPLDNPNDERRSAQYSSTLNIKELQLRSILTRCIAPAFPPSDAMALAATRNPNGRTRGGWEFGLRCTHHGALRLVLNRDWARPWGALRDDPRSGRGVAGNVGGFDFHAARGSFMLSGVVVNALRSFVPSGRFVARGRGAGVGGRGERAPSAPGTPAVPPPTVRPPGMRFQGSPSGCHFLFRVGDRLECPIVGLGSYGKTE